MNPMLKSSRRLRSRATQDATDLPIDGGAEGDIPSVAMPNAILDDPDPEQSERRWRRVFTSRMVVHGLLPVLAMILAVGAGYLKWVDGGAHDAQVASIEAVQAAVDGTTRMLSYQPDTVAQDLETAGQSMTGAFRDSYSELIRDVIIPGAREKRISSTATVPAAACAHASGNHAVVLVFVNQIVAMDAAPPTITTSSVRVTLEKLESRWLISEFIPI